VASPVASHIEVIGADDLSTNMLFSTLYCELHRLAKRELARKWFPSGLSVTTLLHEAYLNISGCERASFMDRGRFMGYAVRVMRGLIIDNARSRNAIKRGGEFQLTVLETDSGQLLAHPRELSAISDSLDQLAKTEPDLAEVVDLKFFCGLSFAEIGALQNISERTVQRKWGKARLYLRCSLQQGMSLRAVDAHA
jgi:RNA polymerase sigma factor (TIGR02999 family)